MDTHQPELAPRLRTGIAVVGVFFGLMTLKEGGSVLFFDGEARRAAGNFIPFVVWFNFLAGFAYLAAGLGIGLRRRWGACLAVALAATTLMAYTAFGIHIFTGGPFEHRTVVAMTLRLVLWSGIAWAMRGDHHGASCPFAGARGR